MEQKINLNDGVYKKCSNMLCVLRIAFLFTMLFPLDILAGNVYSQPKEVSVNLKNVTIRQAISEIEKRSEYLFLITEDAEKYLNRNVNLSAENESINIILDKLLQNTSVKYQVVERQVLVYAGNEKPDTGSIVTGQQKPVRITVKGTVTDNKNRPLAGVAIRVKGTNRGVASDDNGNYEIPDVLPEDILEVTCIGMKSEFYSVRNRTMVNIVMQEDAAFLEEMVVTGYQTIPKERSTGAYSILSSDKLRQKPTANISNILNGLVPGLTVENSSVDGANRFTIRGKGSLRGYQSDSDPLIVLDGFPISNNTETNDPFETINPNDVESITVLKDAAATSIYGACAANGVIVITTKKGKSNKLDISTDAYWSVSSRVDLDYLFNMASAENQFRYVELMHGYNALPLANDPYSDPRNHLTYMSEPRRLLFERDMKGNITADQYNNFKNELIELGNKGVWKDDLNDYIFRKMLRSQYNVALRGKSDVMSYSFSGLYDDEKGFLKGNDKQRVILNINTSSKLTNNLTFDVGLSSSFTKQQNRGSSIYSNLSGIVTPWTRLVGENSEYLHVPTHSTVYESILESECQGKTPADWHYNPIKDRQYIDNSAKTMNYRIHGGFGYSTIWGLNLSAKGQYEWGRSTSHLAYDPESYFVRNYYNTYSTLNASTGMFESYFPNGGIFTDNENVYEAYTIRGQADYNYSKDKHAFSLLAGTEVLSSTTNFTPSITRYGYNKYTNAVQVQPDYISDVVTIFNRVSDAKTKMPYNDLGTLTTYEDRFFSVYANISYTYNDRYSLTGSFRTDASNFQSKKQRDKFSPFWSLGGSWLISRESFMEQVSWVDMLKLRASWGIAGIAAGKRKISSVTTISTRPGNILFNKGESFNDISYPGNETLTWEKSRTVNVGLDMALFNHKLSGSVEFYNKDSYDVLSYATVPTISQGNNSVMFNNAEVLNRGVELSISSNLPITSNLRWQGNINYSYNKNKVTAFYEETPISPRAPGLIEGYPMWSILVLKPAGYTAEGYIKLQGKDGTQETILDNVSSHTSDMIQRQDPKNIENNNWFYYLGSSTPKSNIGFSNQFEWKDLTFSFMITGRFGYYVRRGDEFNTTNLVAASFSKQLDHALAVYDAGYDNQTSYSAYPLYNDDNYQTYKNIEKSVSEASYMFSTNYIKGDHIRLNEIYVGYELPERLLSHQSAFKRINIYAQATNLGIIWSSNKEIDPDYRIGMIRPMPTFMIGLKVNFKNR